ncbi:substrate-binding domain-containing protein [Mycobacterium sp. IS-3022]|uniref:substrate-binding domain-containing protein n=1 Tax=Mycobacterium sp. IS-3022 TaxID=1772277 RepID=UPI0007414FFC|nr:substrate-binding domain-containing protein [Mycobacterium sp. IS-3022]KUH93263.1 hypothetical protein AU188_05175 [Mycobacterium sp. IS-3022]
MGRHSKPDPEDSAGEDRHDESRTERFDRFGGIEPERGAGYFGGFGYPDDRPEHSDDHPDDYSDHYEDYEDDGGSEYPESQSGSGSTPPPGIPPRSGPQHSGDWEGGEWTGSHRAVTAGRRGVSVGVIAALVAVVVAVGAVILWRFFGDALSDRSDQAAARCVDGELAVAVVADPAIAAHIQTLADRYNETAAPVADRCVKIGVKPAESDQVVNGFIGSWPAELGDRPALWIPGSSVSAARLEASAGAQTIIDSRSLVTSPVLLAVRPQLKGALAQQNWSTLPRLQASPASLEQLNLPGWGSLRLSLPLSGDSDASYLAAEAVAAASAPAGAPPSDGTRAVNTLVANQPKLADKKASTAMDALLNAADPATAPVHAVVTTEQQLYQRSAGLPDAGRTVASWLPPGPPAVADFPTVLLEGDWLSQEQKSAASEFARFMRKPEQLTELSEAGFRAEGATPPDSDVVEFAPLPAPLSVGDNEMRATLANALTAPAANPAVTIMLDQSMPADEGGQSRLENVVGALTARLQALPASAAVGLWTFDGTEGRSEVSTGPLSDQVNGAPRSAALTSALDEQSASGGGAVSFTTLRLVYTEAMANFRQGQENSILVITTGPHTDQSLNGDGLQAYIRGAFDPARPVAVNVIDFGSDSDRETWQAVAEASGGNYQNLTSSAGPELTEAIANFLG